MLQIFSALIVVMNLIGFYLMKIDKRRAVNHQFRISEATLWLAALFFGAIGMTLGMRTFRHKTKHAQFKFGLPILSLLEIGIILYVVNLLS